MYPNSKPKPAFILGLLKEAGVHLQDPGRKIILKIPVGLEIRGLRNALVKILQVPLLRYPILQVLCVPNTQTPRRTIPFRSNCAMVV